MAFAETLRAARTDFFKLKKHRAEPAWALWLLTLLFSLAWGVGFLACWRCCWAATVSAR
jgi:hypothetical protein